MKQVCIMDRRVVFVDDDKNSMKKIVYNLSISPEILELCMCKTKYDGVTSQKYRYRQHPINFQWQLRIKH